MAIECYRFTIQGISTGEQCQNVLHFIVDNNDDATPLECASELVTKWDTSFKNLWLAAQSNRYGVRWVQAQRVRPGGGNAFWKEYPEGTQVGAVNEEQGSLQVSPIVKLFTTTDSGVQGRVFMPAPYESAVLSNVLDTDYVSDVIDAIDPMISFAGSVHDWNLAVDSKKNNAAYGVSTATMSEIIGMQGRRRKPL